MTNRQKLWRLVKNGTPLEFLVKNYGNDENGEDLAHYLLKYDRMEDFDSLVEHPVMGKYVSIKIMEIMELMRPINCTHKINDFRNLSMVGNVLYAFSMLGANDLWLFKGAEIFPPFDSKHYNA